MSQRRARLMRKEIIIAGFGGQGVMSIGKNIAEAGVEEGLEMTWVPSYGPEMRGGTSNCSVILSDTRIGTPLIEHPTDIIVMNRPSLAKFEPDVVPGGGVFINSSVVKEKVTREDVNAYYVPSDDIARELGNLKVGNMVMLGAYVGVNEFLRRETVEAMIKVLFAGKKADLIPLNLEALERGINCVK